MKKHRVLSILIVLFKVSLCFVDMAHADLNDGLVAYYPFNGNAYDDSGNGNNGIETGTLSYVSGIAGQAVSFLDGVDNKITLPNKIINVIPMTLNLWINIHDNVLYKIEGINITNDNEFYITLIYGQERYILPYLEGNIYLEYHANKFTINTDRAINVGRWHMLSFIIMNDKTSVYIDGELKETILSAVEGNFNIEKLCFKGDSFFMDDVRIYNRGLSEAEIGELYYSSCYISADIETIREELIYETIQKCQNNPLSCDIPTSKVGEAVTLSNDLSLLHIPIVNYKTPSGLLPLWADLKYLPSTGNKILFEVTNFGQINESVCEDCSAKIYNGFYWYNDVPAELTPLIILDEQDRKELMTMITPFLENLSPHGWYLGIPDRTLIIEPEGLKIVYGGSMGGEFGMGGGFFCSNVLLKFLRQLEIEDEGPCPQE